MGHEKKDKNRFVWGHVYPLICVCPLLDNSTENPEIGSGNASEKYTCWFVISVLLLVTSELLVVRESYLSNEKNMTESSRSTRSLCIEQSLSTSRELWKNNLISNFKLRKNRKDSLGEVFKVQSQYETRNYEVIP